MDELENIIGALEKATDKVWYPNKPSEMTKREEVFEAFRFCVTKPDCAKCPWHDKCEKLKNRHVSIPTDLALAVLRELAGLLPSGVAYDFDGDMICGGCGYRLDKKYDECPGCGRKVKWND